ncbi:ComEA family DNA-binding protein [Pseudoalteromonas sp. MMG012]|uniref:ComEA family DNA-binding protein n=1 Tax=Pseudoalteromonas sp. MMG012 TaxID=2822686 RepID=UPI001B3A5A9D|nr:ComEA family DNA-binding protein [Pseudoalteromonas sp. MMG012]MBQ4848735.1 ComEA family DNA-binding protein [Pseudoalteromonas sp. MMG012]
MHIRNILLVTSILFSTFNHAVENEQSLPLEETRSTSNNKFELVNINFAHWQELAVLPGIGEKKAQAIINYRSQHGNFLDLASLGKVKGIGQGILLKLEGKVSF